MTHFTANSGERKGPKLKLHHNRIAAFRRLALESGWQEQYPKRTGQMARLGEELDLRVKFNKGGFEARVLLSYHLFFELISTRRVNLEQFFADQTNSGLFQPVSTTLQGYDALRYELLVSTPPLSHAPGKVPYLAISDLAEDQIGVVLDRVDSLNRALGDPQIQVTSSNLAFLLSVMKKCEGIGMEIPTWPNPSNQDQVNYIQGVQTPMAEIKQALTGQILQAHRQHLAIQADLIHNLETYPVWIELMGLLADEPQKEA